MALIYKAINNINNKIYIGKTIRTLKDRIQEHQKEIKTKKSLSPFHLSIIKYGINNFSFEILEDNISNELINEKERYYIKKYNAQDKNIGYNIQSGGDGGFTYSKLSKEDVSQIINILLDKENLDSYQEIGKKFNVAPSTIESINKGISWTQVNLNYPLRKYNVIGLTLSKKKYNNIVNELKNTSILLKDICKKYNLSEQQITSINQGYFCYNGQHEYYKDIYSGPFPIRNTLNSQKISKEIFLKILSEYLFTNKSLLSITNKYKISNSSMVYILQGKRRKELTEDFILPIQKNKDKNKIIFQKKYSFLLRKEE